MTLLTGVIYPLLVTLIAQIAFPHQANGSLVMKDGKLAGSSLIGQQFNSKKYFTSRPSFVSYNPLPSGASNYGLTSRKLDSIVKDMAREYSACASACSAAPPNCPSPSLFSHNRRVGVP